MEERTGSPAERPGSHATECDHRRAIVDAIRDGAYVLDADRNRVYANERLEAVAAFDDDLLYAKHPERLVEAGYWSAAEGRRYREAVERVLAGETSDERVQITSTLGTGEEVTTETRLTPYKSDGEVAGVVGVIRDVSDRVARERELERLNERLEHLTGFLSHDLRNPLSVATGYVDHARETGEVEDLDRATAALDRIDGLVTDVLTTMRDPETLSDDAVDVGALARDCWTADDLDRTDEASLVVETDATVRADAGLLRRAFSNLFRNAFTHAGSAPTVRVGVDDEGLYVADDGPGVSAEARDRVREFGVTGAEGTGIGLAIVEQVAELHGWTLRLAPAESGGLRVVLVGVEPTG